MRGLKLAKMVASTVVAQLMVSGSTLLFPSDGGAPRLASNRDDLVRAVARVARVPAHAGDSNVRAAWRCLREWIRDDIGEWEFVVICAAGVVVVVTAMVVRHV